MNEDLGQPWTPPQELTGPTPRPIRRTGWMVALNGQLNEIHLVAKLFSASALLEIFALLLLFLRHNPPQAVIALVVVASTVFLGFGLILAIILPIAYYRLPRVERLLAYGKPARAVVTEVSASTISFAVPVPSLHTRAKVRETTWYFGFEFQDDTGRLVKTVIKGSSPKLSANQVVTVLYDQDEPKEFITYPVAGYEVGRSGKLAR